MFSLTFLYILFCLYSASLSRLIRFGCGGCDGEAIAISNSPGNAALLHEPCCSSLWMQYERNGAYRSWFSGRFTTAAIFQPRSTWLVRTVRRILPSAFANSVSEEHIVEFLISNTAPQMPCVLNISHLGSLNYMMLCEASFAWIKEVYTAPSCYSSRSCGPHVMLLSRDVTLQFIAWCLKTVTARYNLRATQFGECFPGSRNLSTCQIIRWYAR